MRLKPAALLTGPYDWGPDILPVEEFRTRIAHAQGVLAGHNASALIVHGNSAEYGALAYSTGFAPKLGPAFALIAPGHPVRLLVSGSPTMLSAAKRLTWVEDVRPIGDLKRSITAWLDEIGRPDNRSIGLWGHSAMTLRPYSALSAAIEPRGTIVELDATLESLRLRKSPIEQDLSRRSSAILRQAICELARAFAPGNGTRSTALAAERAAFRQGAQDARVLVSARDGGTPVIPSHNNDSEVHPLLAYAAVRFAGYWAEGFVTLSRSRSGALVRAQSGLAAMLESAQAGVLFSDLVSIAAEQVRPYGLHPLVLQSVANSIGLSIEEPCGVRPPKGEALQPDGIYTLRCGATGPGLDNAIVSAMIRVQECSAEVLWSALDGVAEDKPGGTPS